MRKPLKKKLSFVVLFIFCVVTWFNFARINYYSHSIYYAIENIIASKTAASPDLKHFDQRVFETKANAPIPTWMSDRISKELRFFKQQKISQNSLNITFNKITALQSLYRFRIIDNTLYVYKTPYVYDIQDDPLPLLVKILKKSDSLKLSYADFIISYSDGMPIAHVPVKNYWMTDNINDQAPILTPAKLDSAPSLICIPDRLTTHEWPLMAKKIQLANCIHPWSKKEKKAFWRGGGGGCPHSTELFHGGRKKNMHAKSPIHSMFSCPHEVRYN